MARVFGCTLHLLALLLHVIVNLSAGASAREELNDVRLLGNGSQDQIKERLGTSVHHERPVSQQTISGRLTSLAGGSLRHKMEAQTAELPQPAFVAGRGRRRRETSELPPLDDDTKPSELQGKNCDQLRAPANPTVVAGIVGGALAFFLVVVLTIIYCSYKNHPPSEIRKRVAELYTYIGEIEDVIWMPAVNPADNGTCGHVKFDGFPNLYKYQRQA